MESLEIARVFFEEWDRLLTYADKLEDQDRARAEVNREPVNSETIRTTRAIAKSLERIGDTLRKIHYGEE